MTNINTTYILETIASFKLEANYKEKKNSIVPIKKKITYFRKVLYAFRYLLGKLGIGKICLNIIKTRILF